MPVPLGIQVAVTVKAALLFDVGCFPAYPKDTSIDCLNRALSGHFALVLGGLIGLGLVKGGYDL